MSNYTVNEIFRRYGEEYQKKRPFLSDHEKKVIRAIQNCRTEKLGGRTEVCEQCGHTVRIFHSCRDRHCPQCQFMKKEQWVADRKNTVFPFQHFHVVFTLPHQLLPLIPRNKKNLYDAFFKTVKETLLSVADEKKYFGARIGFFSILHSWGQKMNLHPHLHCVVPGGGLTENNTGWIKSPKNFLLPIPVLKKRFRSKFLITLKKLYLAGNLDVAGSSFSNPNNFQRLIDKLFEMEWVVYLKESFRNSDSVIEYLSRYTHRIAISNYRILNISDDGFVSFTFKDYKENNARKTMVLSASDFMHRFMMHVVPSRYVRIRYFGIMANRNHKENLKRCRDFYEIKSDPEAKKKPVWDQLMIDVTGTDIHQCPNCKTGTLKLWIPEWSVCARSPPEEAAI